VTISIVPYCRSAQRFDHTVRFSNAVTFSSARTTESPPASEIGGHVSQLFNCGKSERFASSTIWIVDYVGLCSD
jgi:hypothetical protein